MGCADFDPDDGLVCTVGKLSVWPGASNVIAGSANFTVRVPASPGGSHIKQADSNLLCTDNNLL